MPRECQGKKLRERDGGRRSEMMVNQMLKNENFMVFHLFGGIAERKEDQQNCRAMNKMNRFILKY